MGETYRTTPDVGDTVELYPTIPSKSGVSIVSGSTGVVEKVDVDESGGPKYLVKFADPERPLGESVWLARDELFTSDEVP